MMKGLNKMQTLNIVMQKPMGQSHLKALLASAIKVLYIYQNICPDIYHNICQNIWWARIKGRREMARLDKHILADVGINPDERDKECAKPFWKA